MKLWVARGLAAFSLLNMAAQTQAQMAPDVVAALQRQIASEQDGDVTTVPITPHLGKFAIKAALNGIDRQFFFDTGSPTMISRDLAEELDLTIIGSNAGRDANGREFTTAIAIVDRLTIGTITFRSVPVLIADFSIADPNGCFFDGGVIGSEIFPGHVWNIDAEQNILKIATKFEALGSRDVLEQAIVTPLHDFGYPHAPIFDYSIGEFNDKGLFDTGSSDSVTLFEPIARDAQAQDAMVSGTVRRGRGSHGVSAAGRGTDSDLLRFEIEGVQLGAKDLGRQAGTTRNAAPSLIGLGILATHGVTLDYPNGRMILHRRSDAQPMPRHPGFALTLNDGEVRVSQIFDNSPAQQAGLALGDRVVAIDGQNLSLEGASCETSRWLIETHPAQSARQLTVHREGKRIEINLQDR